MSLDKYEIRELVAADIAGYRGNADHIEMALILESRFRLDCARRREWTRDLSEAGRAYYEREIARQVAEFLSQEVVS